MSSSEEEGPKPKRKRGVTNEDSYKRNKIRNARVKGEAYVNYKNNLVPQKVKPIGIICKCPNKCTLEINQTIIDDTWQNFYSLQSKDLQDTYLQTLIEFVEVKRRCKKTQDPEINVGDGNNDANVPVPSFKRNCTYTYHVKVNGVLKVVCKSCFLQVHGISRQRLSRICQLLRNKKTPTDKRGKNKSGNAKSGAICFRIHEHISKFD